jgi:hypothetical protein
LKGLRQGQGILELLFFDEPFQIGNFRAEFKGPFEILGLCQVVYFVILQELTQRFSIKLLLPPDFFQTRLD